MNTSKKLKILVVEDSSKHQEAARQQLAAHSLTVVGAYDEAQDLLQPKVDEDKRDNILRAQFGHCRSGNCKGDEEYKRFRAADKSATEQATTYPDFDVVMLDLMLPASMCGVDGPGGNLEGQEMPLGTILAFLALKYGCKKVAVLTDMNHHRHPASAALDVFDRTRFLIGDASVYLSDNFGQEVKNWGMVLKLLLTGAE